MRPRRPASNPERTDAQQGAAGDTEGSVSDQRSLGHPGDLSPGPSTDQPLGPRLWRAAWGLEFSCSVTDSPWTLRRPGIAFPVTNGCGHTNAPAEDHTAPRITHGLASKEGRLPFGENHGIPVVVEVGRPAVSSPPPPQPRINLLADLSPPGDLA